VLPEPGRPGSGAHVFLEGVRTGLRRFVALPAEVLGPLATRFRASCSELGMGLRLERRVLVLPGLFDHALDHSG
jgi:hypothetical protein